MAEWKTWSFGSPDVDPTAPPSSMNPPLAPIPEPTREPPATPGAATNPAERWGEDIEPFTLDRLEQVMTGDGVPAAREETAVMTSVDSAVLSFHREPADAPWMQVESRWLLPEDLEGARVDPLSLQHVANEWNAGHLQPTLYPDRIDERWCMVLVSRFFVGEGLSDRQIHLLVHRSIVVTLQAVRELPGLFPPSEGE